MLFNSQESHSVMCSVNGTPAVGEREKLPGKKITESFIMGRRRYELVISFWKLFWRRCLLSLFVMKESEIHFRQKKTAA